MSVAQGTLVLQKAKNRDKLSASKTCKFRDGLVPMLHVMDSDMIAEGHTTMLFMKAICRVAALQQPGSAQWQSLASDSTQRAMGPLRLQHVTSAPHITGPLVSAAHSC